MLFWCLFWCMLILFRSDAASRATFSFSTKFFSILMLRVLCELYFFFVCFLSVWYYL